MKKQMRKPISILLSLLMVLSAFGVLTLTVAAEAITISIVDVDGESFSLNVDTEDTFGSVKEKIEELRGYPVALQTLWLPNGIGAPDDETLSYRGIGDGVTLTLEVDLPENRVPVYTSAEGLEDGALYMDITSVENVIKAELKDDALADIVYDEGIGMNIQRAFLDYLRNAFPDEWADAVAQVRAENPGLSDDAFAFDGGWPLYEAEEAFYTILTATEESAAAALAKINEDLGTKLTTIDDIVNENTAVWDVLANAYLEKYHSDLIEAAEAEAASAITSLYTAKWSIDLNHPDDLQAMIGDEEWYEASHYAFVLKPTMNVVGAVWEPIAITDAPATLENGAYYLPKSFVEGLFTDLINQWFGDRDFIETFDIETGESVTYTKAEYLAKMVESLGSFFVNTTAAADSAFRYKNVVTQTMLPGEAYTSTTFLPLAERGYGYMNEITAAVLDENVTRYHPTHVYGADGTYIDAQTHSLTCTICGEVKTEAHDVIVRGGGDATCGDEGYTGDEYCSVCGQRLSEGTIIPATGNHTTEIRNAKEATKTEDGYTGDEVCTVCGKTVKQGEVIPATGDTTPDTPDTPDDSGDCPYCGKHHKKIWVYIIHLVLWFFQKAVSIFTK